LTQGVAHGVINGCFFKDVFMLASEQHLVLNICISKCFKQRLNLDPFWSCSVAYKNHRSLSVFNFHNTIIENAQRAQIANIVISSFSLLAH
jgi:hypothetical protein